MPHPYKETWTPERVMTTMHEGAGKYFDPNLIEYLVQVMPQIVPVQEECRLRDVADTGGGEA